jgi:hypothetical protein
MITRAVIVLLVLIFAAACYLTLRLRGIGRHKGQRRAPRWYTAEDERIALPCERTIPRAVTEHAPPWDDQPAPIRVCGFCNKAAVWRWTPRNPPPAYHSLMCDHHAARIDPGELHELGAAPVIEPAAVTHGPPPRPVTPPGDWVMTAVVTGGQVTELRAAVLPPPPAPTWPGELHPEVAKLLGYATVHDALASMYRRADALELLGKLADGAA